MKRSPTRCSCSGGAARRLDRREVAADDEIMRFLWPTRSAQRRQRFALGVAAVLHAAAVAWCALIPLSPPMTSMSLHGETLTLQAAMASAPAAAPVHLEPTREEPRTETVVIVRPRSIQVGRKRFDREPVARRSVPPSPLASHVSIVPQAPSRAPAALDAPHPPEPRRTRVTRTPPLRPSPAQIPRRVGSRESLLRAEFVFSPPPSYPPSALAEGWNGTVVLRVTIAVDGQVTDVEVAESSGHAVLDGAAAAAVRRWRMRPLTDWGRNRPWTIRLPVIFQQPRS